MQRLSLWYGVCGAALHWFKSYLSVKHQRVVIGDCLYEYVSAFMYACVRKIPRANPLRHIPCVVSTITEPSIDVSPASVPAVRGSRVSSPRRPPGGGGVCLVYTLP